ncbi:SDR family oxidoreductase, partial [bacterium]
ALRNPPFKVRNADLSQPGSGAALLEDERPEILLHCAAVANLETAEKNPALAQRVNADLPGELAEASHRLGVRMVHLSTDAVFDGLKGPYTENDPPNPLSAYARSKRAGELAVAAANSRAIIARVNFYGWSLTGRRSLAEFFFNNLSAGKTANGWTDVFFCPLEVNTLGDLLLQMAQEGLEGLYHVVSPESLSKYDFGRGVARAFGFDEALVKPTRVSESGLSAARSPDLRLSTAKLARDLGPALPGQALTGQALPGQAAGLARFQRQFVEGYPERLRALAA